MYGNLFVFLEENKGLDLLAGALEQIANELTEKRNCGHFLFTIEQKDKFYTELEPGRFSVEELRNFNEEFSGEPDEETAVLTKEAIKVLYNNLAKVEDEKQVLLLIVG